MENITTVGQLVEARIAKATAEMLAGQAALSAKLPMHGGLNPLAELEKHMIEAMDAMLDAACAIEYPNAKKRIFEELASRHGLRISQWEETQR